MKLYDFMHDTRTCGDAFKDASWDGWRIIARLYDGDAALLSPEQAAIARKLIGRDQLPTVAPRELFIGAGRRSGKTRFDSMMAVHAAAQDYSANLAAGEWATVSIHAVDKRQARTAFGYCLGFIEGSPLLTAEVSNQTAESIEFKHRTRIEIHTASFRSIRGYSLALAVIDEAAYLRDESSATPDVELYRSLMPALATLNGRLVVTSSLHRKVGLMWNKYREHFGVSA
jgi:phage terminase large subunit-like protein